MRARRPALGYESVSLVSCDRGCALLRRLLRNSSTSGSPLQQSEVVTRAALAVPRCAQQRRCSDRFAPTRLQRARRGTGQQASPRRGAFSGLKNNSATAPSSPPGASPPVRCVGDCCFRKPLSGQAGRSALSRAQQPPSCLRPRGSIGAVAALLSASESTSSSACTSQRAVGQHLWQPLGSHSHCSHHHAVGRTRRNSRRVEK